ncbi:hypothetical protein ACFL39_00600 [Gemmatimonadota bacterium]
MLTAVFIRVNETDIESRGERLCEEIEQFRASTSAGLQTDVFSVRPDDFRTIPGSPFAYWVDEDIRRIFSEFPPLEGNAGTVKQGLATADDFRFVRAWWEVDPTRIGNSSKDADKGRGWVHFAKGGSYSPYHSDVHLVVNWSNQGIQMKSYVVQRYPYLKGNWGWVVKNEGYFFQPGLTWPQRSQKGFSIRALPDGCCFGHKGPAVIPNETRSILPLLAICNSRVYLRLVEAQMTFGSYDVGVLQRTPIPNLWEEDLCTLALQAVQLARETDIRDEVTHSFTTVITSGTERSEQEASTRNYQCTQDLHVIIEQTVKRLYLIKEENYSINYPEVSLSDSSDDHATMNTGDRSSFNTGNDILISTIQWCLGIVFGRWDVRMAQDQGLLPDLQGPFERLPQVAPAGLVGPNGLPATPDSIVSEAWLRARPDVITLPEQGSVEGPVTITSDDYPIDVAWNGILVDDPDHPKDIVRKVREVLQYIFGDRADEIEQEALEILRGDGKSPTNLRDWFRNQRATALGKNFFEYHIDRYSKSRRKAPIYWRLCSHPSKGQGRYAVWLYYHQLNDDTLWTVLNDYLGPKRVQEQQEADKLRAELGSLEGRERAQTEKDLEEKQELLDELQWMDEELRKVLARQGGYAPDRDDGVVINMAPLHRLVPWDEPAKIWEKLEAGEYDWAKLAMRYWPERVNAKCEKDKSLSIAHSRER